MSLSKKFLFFTLILALFKTSLATDYIVGDSEGWTAMGGVDYQEWVSQKSFYVGDTIEFQYNNKFHNIVLEKAEHYYFLCGYPGHCQAGQKLDILVKLASSPPPSNQMASSPSSSNTTPDNTASSSTTPYIVTLFHSSILVVMGLTSLLLLVLV
ncbi:hypothetical protein ACFE04_010337 [Oxalis oulophora]